MTDTTCDPDLLAAVGAALDGWLTSDSPPTVPNVLLGLRAAEAGTTGEVRDLWGCAALNWEAAAGQSPDGRPGAGELRAVALEYAQLASRVSAPGAVR
ncbi:hypothetical protein ACFC26_41295 [Kitasatospora purpeofusca]|uniref:hypothetical protein n=1 Tax=Kitasatospora purpeofusca TaxID=67352 RepID=UPI0035DAE722